MATCVRISRQLFQSLVPILKGRRLKRPLLAPVVPRLLTSLLHQTLDVETFARGTGISGCDMWSIALHLAPTTALTSTGYFEPLTVAL